jgi:hypothetical protein
VHARPDTLALAALEAAFAAALAPDASAATRAAAATLVVGDDIAADARLQFYLNNVEAIFQGALARTFPVLCRRVGDAHFAMLARDYRAAHPSRSGDLHWVGRDFPQWLAARTAGGEYAWLADLARLEWACEEVLVCEYRPPVGVERLATVAPDALHDVRLSLQPGLRCVSSPYPVWSVWVANQPGTAGAPVNPALGAEHVVATQDETGLVLHAVPLARLHFVAALERGETLSGSLESSGLPVDELGPSLGWLFGAGLVTGLSPPERCSPATEHT